MRQDHLAHKKRYPLKSETILENYDNNYLEEEQKEIIQNM